MITTVFHISWLNLKRDRVALLLTFVLPLVFFSIFASVFGAMDSGQARKVTTVIAVEDEHPVSVELAALLRRDPALEVVDLPVQSPALADPGRMARRLVESGRAAIAVVIPRGFGDSLVGGDAGSVAVELLSDRANPIASGLLGGLLQAAALELGVRALDGGGIPGVLGASGAEPASPLRLEIVDVLGGAGKRPSVAFFAAGIGVMFLLFAVSGRSAILIEERENGVLKRMLAGRLSLTQLLLGRWLFLVALGSVQVTVMFVWASLAFGLDLWTARHLAGFAVVTLAAAAAAAAFGLVLSSACRTRAQLNGVATVVILVLSALGGSMFPRFLMPEGLERLGRATFNAWALDGYQKVFWYEAALPALWRELLVLAAFGLAFLIAARIVAGRWLMA